MKIKYHYHLIKVLAISCSMIVISFLWQGHKGFSLWDEGFLWYGVQRVLLGDVPILDFMAYDPGRYYWTAILVNIMGDNGIISVRIAVALFQVLGLFVGLVLISQTERNNTKQDYLFLILSASILLVWMFPRHKLFDISLSILLIGVLTFLVRNPIPKRYFIAGMCVGFVAVFGRNHGVYGAISCIGLFIWMKINNQNLFEFLRNFLFWGAGVLVGFSPIILMIIFIPNFAFSFWESIIFLFELKSTNIPLPIPWPWLVNFSNLIRLDTLKDLLTGIFFIAILFFGCFSIIFATYQRIKLKSVSPALVASAFLAFPYAHYAFSRADVGHLAQGIFPLLIG